MTVPLASVAEDFRRRGHCVVRALASAEEVAAIRALRAAFPDVPLRLDPNAAWSVGTSIRVGRSLEGILEYLEDPTSGLSAMAEVATTTRPTSA